MANLATLTVVITCYREGDLLLEAIESVRQQTLAPLEIILVNDASPDDRTNQVCRQLETDPGITLVWQARNGGPSVARNAGFAAAQGEILVPLDADDLLPPDALAHIQQAFEQYPEAEFVYGSYRCQRYPGDTRLVKAEPISLNSLLRSRRFSLSTNWSLIGTAPLRKSLWEAVGHSDPELGAEDLHDLEFWLRAMALPCSYYGIPDEIYIWRKYLGRNSRQVSPESWYRIAQKHFEVYRQHGLEYRAYELLLLGSKWMNRPNEIQKYRRALLTCIGRGQFQFSSLVALAIPAGLFQPLANLAKRYR
ncbi:glycosyltransferase family 2 protein [Nodosilinea sp. LEGE 07088]|uniref:glycosyltransferase family 2 protein n=1 Tax=Nodosilinea sp. LEGE 07088 TaxID=2777968 RepID=UPI00187FA24A|nr:glycosyltransferase family 2 protein [Nodosilinea sp. LEGE 07088]MBE9138797.1 glycosyltransferase family 2 protein [Nodosilinea sp. LEGE 07088]